MVRVHELAKELACTSNELLVELKKMGSDAVKALNQISPEEEKFLREKFQGGLETEPGPKGRDQVGKRVALNDDSQGYEPVRLRGRDTGIKRDFRGSEQAASSTLSPKKPKRGGPRERESTTTKIIKKTIVRKRYIRTQGGQSEGSTATPVVEQQRVPVEEVPEKPSKDRRPRKRSRLTIEGATLPKAQEEAPVVEPVAVQQPAQKAKAEAPPSKKKRRPEGRTQTKPPPPGKDLRDRDRRPKPRPPKGKESPEVNLQKSLQQLQEKGIKSDLTTAGRKPVAGKKTKKKRKKILDQDRTRRFEKTARVKVKGRSRDNIDATDGLVKRKGRRRSDGRGPALMRPQVMHKKVKVTPSMTIKDLSEATGIKAGEIIKFLVSDLGVFATINQVVDLDIIKLILENFDFEYDVRIREVEDEIEHEPDKEGELVRRPPVVVVLGHVDHGKTKLLDAIRHANVIDTEAGAITQHIGAYQAQVDGRKITFLDTPGHEAFTAMRARGAQVTDIAILVVACDDGVMPQTIEAINHARSAGLEIIVALNKIDKENADPERIKSQLAEYGFVPEEWGGKTIMVPISAKFGQGIDELLEMVLLTADVLDLKGNPKARAEGTVLEARLDKGLGVVATVLDQRGTLKPGTVVVSGASWGRIRQMTDEHGKQLKDCPPATPCQITGLSDLPEAGDKLYQVKDEKVAKEIYSQRQINKRQERIHAVIRIRLDDFYEHLG